MRADLAQMAALVSYWNSHVDADDTPVDWSAHSAFRYVKQVSFRFVAWRFLVARGHSLVARTPTEWFAWLRSRGAVGLTLRITNRGGWLIQVQTANEVQVWHSTLKFSRPDSGLRKWNGTFWGERGAKVAFRDPLTVAAAIEQLDMALERISTFAGQESLFDWRSRFDRARELLRADGAIPYHPDMLFPPWSPDAHRLAAASASAWVFHGMGSWDEIRGATRRRPEYAHVTAQLHDAVNDGIAAAANSGESSST